MSQKVSLIVIIGLLIALTGSIYWGITKSNEKTISGNITLNVTKCGNINSNVNNNTNTAQIVHKYSIEVPGSYVRVNENEYINKKECVNDLTKAGCMKIKLEVRSSKIYHKVSDSGTGQGTPTKLGELDGYELGPQWLGDGAIYIQAESDGAWYILSASYNFYNTTAKIGEAFRNEFHSIAKTFKLE